MLRVVAVAFAVVASLLVARVSGLCAQQQFMSTCQNDDEGCCWVTDTGGMTSCEACNGIAEAQQTHLADFYENFYVEQSPAYGDHLLVDKIGCLGGGTTEDQEHIACDVEGNINVISFTDDGLWGDAAGLCSLIELNMPFLDAIILTDNYIHGTLPSCMNSLSATHLERMFLSHNFLRGTVPALTALTRLDDTHLDSTNDHQAQCQLTTNGQVLGPETNCFDCPIDNVPPACTQHEDFNHCLYHGTAAVTECPAVGDDLPAAPVVGTTTPPPPACQGEAVQASACVFTGGAKQVAPTSSAACRAVNSAATTDDPMGASASCKMARAMKAGCSKALKMYECSRSCPSCAEASSAKPCKSVCEAVNTACTSVLTTCGITLDCATGNTDCRAQVPGKDVPPPSGIGGACNGQKKCKTGLACTAGKCAMMANSVGDPMAGDGSLAHMATAAAGFAAVALAL